MNRKGIFLGFFILLLVGVISFIIMAEKKDSNEKVLARVKNQPSLDANKSILVQSKEIAEAPIKFGAKNEINNESVSKSKDNNTPEVLASKNKSVDLAVPQNIEQNKTYQEAIALISEGKEHIETGISFVDSNEEEDAQVIFREALISFDISIKKLDSIKKDYPSDKKFKTIDSNAQALKFFLEKSCLR